MTEPSPTEAWLTAARQGDSLALAKLLAIIYPHLRARAETRMDAELKTKMEPDDLLQEVYLRIFQHIETFEDRGPASFFNWTYTILDHELVNAHRAAHRRARDVAREVSPHAQVSMSGSYWNLLDHVYTDSDTPSRVVRREEVLGALLECLDDLSESHRNVVRLRFLEGLSVSEVAARLSKTEAAVVALTQRALHALREALDRRGDFTRNG